MRWRTVVATALFTCTATLAIADEPTKPAAPPAQAQAEMAAMMKAATPGDAHKKLSGMVGTFDATIKMWGQPGAPPMQAAGVSHNEWALDGRWIEQRFDGTFMGMPFRGIGFTGYDNIKQKYVGSWMDNMSTSMMVSTGTGDASGKSYEFNSTMDDPMTGKTSAVKEKVTVVDEDHHTMEMWGSGRDGKTYKMMEIAYTRKK